MTEFEEIYRNYFKDVYLYLKGLTNDPYMAEEITSETFLKALKSIDTFRGACDVRVWLCQIAKNCYYSYLRKHRRIVNLDELPDQDRKDGPEQLVCSAELSLKLHEILHELTEPYKEVFTLRVFGELSFRQIGHLFGKTENWACVTYHRAKNKIREKMEDDL
ncbi:sigma-70 family RNA polymerase sigma factor [Diplocloster hominis]|uniref:RNA polymerase sigma factor n=1 Tax=Diplocloster hominis TaxID=3079010 RepID=UPI0031BA4244